MLLTEMYPSGNETESFQILQDIGLIQKSRHCENCDEYMNLYPSETVDLFKWICPQCKESYSTKENSPLQAIDCSYDKILGILWAWCNSEEIVETAIKFCIEPRTVMNIYSIAGAAVENHIKRNNSKWKIGGPGIIVLIDTFPEICSSGNRQNNRPILCLAELKGFPLSIIFHPLQEEFENQQNSQQMMKANCQAFIRNFVHPESTVVARRNATFSSYEDILSNQPQFNVIESDEDLLKHETVGRSLHAILSTIWEGALYVCMDAQYYPPDLVQSFLFSHMWNNKFCERAYPLILREIANLVMDAGSTNNPQ